LEGKLARIEELTSQGIRTSVSPDGEQNAEKAARVGKSKSEHREAREVVQYVRD